VADLNPQPAKKVEEVFEAVLQLPASERSAYLEHTCGDDLSRRTRSRRCANVTLRIVDKNSVDEMHDPVTLSQNRVNDF
jgi:hypothetical protein